MDRHHLASYLETESFRRGGVDLEDDVALLEDGTVARGAAAVAFALDQRPVRQLFQVQPRSQDHSEIYHRSIADTIQEISHISTFISI